MKSKLKSLFLILIGVGIGLFAATQFKQKNKFEIEKAFPAWTNYQPCLKPTDSDQRLFTLAVEVLEEAAKGSDVLWIDLGATKFLGHGIYKRIDKKSTPVCTPVEVYQRASLAITASKAYDPRLETYQFNLAEKILNPTPYIVQKIGDAAFNKHAQIEKGKDLRSKARTVLASYGVNSKDYAEKAYDLMSNDDSLGTGAAQVAAANDYKDSLTRIESFMAEILAKTPKEETISWRDRRRFYELAYALYFSGNKGKLHSSPIKEFMQRKVESNATMFGYVSLHPKSMCQIYEEIHGKDSSVLEDYSYCSDEEYPYDR